MLSNQSEKCCICLEDLEKNNLFVSKCGHSMHGNCFEQFVKSSINSCCPICRSDDIPDFETSSLKNENLDLNNRISSLVYLAREFQNLNKLNDQVISILREKNLNHLKEITDLKDVNCKMETENKILKNKIKNITNYKNKIMIQPNHHLLNELECLREDKRVYEALIKSNRILERKRQIYEKVKDGDTYNMKELNINNGYSKNICLKDIRDMEKLNILKNESESDLYFNKFYNEKTKQNNNPNFINFN